MSAAERWIAALVLASVAIIGAVLFCAWPLIALAADGERAGKGFFVASESMWPTLHLNDRVIPRAVAAEAVGRGAVVVVSMPDGARIYRVAGVAGDRVGMRNGLVLLNGRVVPETRVGGGPLRAERFPGEPAAHRIADEGTGPGDDVAPVPVPPGRLFLLGDNRDRSADSRYGPEELGAGLVDARSVIGVVDTAIRRDGWRMRAVGITPAR